MKRVLGVVGLTVLIVTGVALVVPTAGALSPPDTSPPTEPGVITVSSVTSTGASLTWATSKDNVGIEGYRIWRGLNGGPMSIIYTNDGLEYYTATNLHSNATYQFGVTAIDSANNESPMQTTTVTTPASTDTTVPSPPSDASLSIKAFSSTRLDVLWGNSPSSNVAYYEVFRGGVQIATVDRPNAPHYSDNGLSPSTTYNYAIVAVSSAGLPSVPTVTKSGTTTAPGVVSIPRGPVVSVATGSSGIVSWWTNIPTSGTLTIAGQVLTDSSGVVEHHVVSVSGLPAASTSPYTVASVDPGTGQSASASGSITTAALPGQTFSFAAMGDFGGGGPGEVNNAANMAKAGTQFLQTLGDNIYPSSGLPDPDFATTYSDYDSHFYKEMDQVVGTQAFFPANGNKDYYSNGEFWVNFPMPGTNHEWYSYNWGDAHILVLDSEEPMAVGSDQYNFAQADLAANQGEKWRIVAIQRPPYSSTTNNSSSRLAQVLVPLFQAYRVNLVLSGNSHNYERSYPLTNGVQDNTNGITYIVSGGGGSGFDAFTAAYPEPAWSAFRESDYFEFAKITVSPTTIHVDAIRADTDTVLDSTTITASPTAPASDFSITSSPPSASVAAGSTASATIATSVTSGAGETVALSASGAPSDAQVTFSPPTIASGQSATMRVTTSASTPAGTYPISVTGAGSTSHSTTVTLTVLASPPSAPTSTGPTGSGCMNHLPSGTVVGAAAPADGSGYYEVDGAGDVAAFGGAPCYGSMTGTHLNRPIVGMAIDPATGGYWLVATDGGIFSFGNAPFYGSTGGLHLNQPIVGMSSDRSGSGYWMVASDGGIFAFGEAPFLGSTGGTHLNRPVVGMAVDPATGGYWLVATDGGIFSFGNAPFYGSTGGIHLNRPVVGMSPVADGSGYRLVASDGGIFTFGTAPFYGSTGNIALNRPIIAGMDDRAGDGYWLVASDGGIFSFHAPFYGSAA